MYIIAHYSTRNGEYEYDEVMWYEGSTQEECLDKARAYLPKDTDEDDNILHDKEGNVIGVDYFDTVIKINHWEFHKTKESLTEAILHKTKGY